MGEHTWRIPEKSATVVPEFGFGERGEDAFNEDASLAPPREIKRQGRC